MSVDNRLNLKVRLQPNSLRLGVDHSMKIVIAIVILTVIEVVSIKGQSQPYRIEGITRIAKFERFGNKPAVEFKVAGPVRVGGLFNCLQIGTTVAIREGGFASKESAILFYLPLKDWKKLKNKSPMWITWGCISPSLLASQKEQPFAYLDKKMLISKP